MTSGKSVRATYVFHSILGLRELIPQTSGILNHAYCYIDVIVEKMVSD